MAEFIPTKESRRRFASVVAMVYELLWEPMTTVEVWRKYNALSEEEGVETVSRATISSALKHLYEDERIERRLVRYGSSVSSPKSRTGEEWYDYIIYWVPEEQKVNPLIYDAALRRKLSPDMTPEEKEEIIKILSEMGKENMEHSEEILLDCLMRQFRYYKEKGQLRKGKLYPDINIYSPDIDFMVKDESRRRYYLAVEISTRWENPIDVEYIQKKFERIMDLEEKEKTGIDLLVLAPKFTEDALVKYEKEHKIKVGDGYEYEVHKAGVYDYMVHLHEVPTGIPFSYPPVPKPWEKPKIMSGKGFPVIIPDIERIREKIKKAREKEREYKPKYPIVIEEMDKLEDALNKVWREFVLIPEFEYRNQIREAIEPLLPEFISPYKIEQFLIDYYWKRGLTYAEIAELVETSPATIGNWMAETRWDIFRRREVSPEVKEIWKRMYLGEDPFEEEHSIYRVIAEYGRHPDWALENWRKWYEETTEEERVEFMSKSDPYIEALDYTIMVGVKGRLLPSYSFVHDELKKMGVKIREPEEAVRVPYVALADRGTLEWMINKETGYVSEIPARGHEDVEVFDSYFEVDVGNWLSLNEVPWAHEPLVIPSERLVSRERWKKMAEAIREMGMFNGVNIAKEWLEIYEKHNLMVFEIPPARALKEFDLKYIIPDILIYLGASKEKKGPEWDWHKYDYIIEVSGLYGVRPSPEIIGKPTKFKDWYRAANVAFKELVYKVLGLWDKVYFIIPRQKELPRGIYEDPHFIVMNPVVRGLNIEKLALLFKIPQREIDIGLMQIGPVFYKRRKDKKRYWGVPQKFEYNNILVEEIPKKLQEFILKKEKEVKKAKGKKKREMERELAEFRKVKAFSIDENWTVLYVPLCEVYIGRYSEEEKPGFWVKESLWRNTNIKILRMWMAHIARILEAVGVITNPRWVEYPELLRR